MKTKLLLKTNFLSITFLTLVVLFFGGSPIQAQTSDSVKLAKLKPTYRANLNKNDYFAGGTLSLNTKKTVNKDALILNIDDELSSVASVGVDGGYALKDNFFVGLGIEYGQSRKKGNYTESDVEKYKQVFTNKMEFRPFVKTYVPLGESRRFNIITQAELSFSLQQSITQSLIDSEITRTLSKTYNAGIGIRPGISVFVIDNFAIETTVNVAGITYSYQKSETTNQLPTTVRQGIVDLKIDIIQLNLGFFVYF